MFDGSPMDKFKALKEDDIWNLFWLALFETYGHNEVSALEIFNKFKPTPTALTSKPYASTGYYHSLLTTSGYEVFSVGWYDEYSPIHYTCGSISSSVMPITFAMGTWLSVNKNLRPLTLPTNMPPIPKGLNKPNNDEQ